MQSSPSKFAQHVNTARHDNKVKKPLMIFLKHWKDAPKQIEVVVVAVIEVAVVIVAIVAVEMTALVGIEMSHFPLSQKMLLLKQRERSRAKAI